MAGQKCKVCSHATRAAAEEALAYGHSVRDVAKRFGLPYQSLDRHQRNCARVAIQEAAKERQIEHGSKIAERMEDLHKVTLELLQEARERRDPAEARLAIGTARKNLELLARLSGELDPVESDERRSVTFEEFELMYKARRIRTS